MMDFDTLVAALVTAQQEFIEQELVLSPDDQLRAVEALERIADALERHLPGRLA
jgi:hypothetical protein